MAPVLLVILLATLSRATLMHYRIVPINFTDLCGNYLNGTCFTLDELSSRVSEYDRGNITLSFLPGDHLLTWNMRFDGATSITLKRETHNFSNSSSTIHCLENTGFDFWNNQALTIDELEISGCKRKSNGGAMFVRNVSNVYIKACSFLSNRMTGSDSYMPLDGARGGAIRMLNIQTAFIQGSAFINNSVSYGYGGGAIFIQHSGTVAIESCDFRLNQGSSSGGALSMYFVIDVTITNTTFFRNSATTFGHGGAIYSLAFNTVSVLNVVTCLFKGNYANQSGGAISANRIKLHSSENVFEDNSCPIVGGAVYDAGVTAIFNGDSFSNNTASNAAAIYHGLQEKIAISNSTFTDNQCIPDSNSVVYVHETSLTVSGDVSFLNNHGSLYLFSSQVEFYGAVMFINNTGESGGAITSTASVITFKTTSRTTISGNTASYGGGVFLDQSTIYIFGPILITDNTAEISGGGIYAFQSQIEFRAEHVITDQADILGLLASKTDKIIQHTKLANNIAHASGGGMYLTGSNIKVSQSYLLVYNNSAKDNGGGIYLEETSRIVLNKHLPERTHHNFVKLELTNNSALRGGAVYVSDSSNTGGLCETDYSNKQLLLSSKQCFLQILNLNKYFSGPVIEDDIPNTTNVFFKNNIAEDTGGDIYGGLLDRCTVSPFTVRPQFTLFNMANELLVLFSTAYFDWANQNSTKPIDYSHHISSDAVYLCFCVKELINCSYTYPTVFVKKGGMFTISIVAMDQVRNPLNASIISSLVSESRGIGRLKVGQEKQHVGSQCTELQYNAYSTADAAKIVLYAEGPCGNQGISKKVLNVTFLPCNCPVGFQRSPSPIDCVCECDIRLKSYVNNCSSENETIQVVRSIWIEYTNTTNDSGYVIQDCPYDYCEDKPVNISLNSPREADKQCAFNRTGNICGKCEEGLSLVFATTKCKRCSNYFLFLLIPFALAGIALVVFILLLNMTVATGTINGLVFYANILAANRSIFLPFDTPNILTVFISWLNLDLGIEVCFYDGMDSYGKLLLQLVFPAYLFLLIGIIIALCEHSQRIATILGKRNPVATLGTLILLSYSKLLRTIIVALQYTILSYPDGSRDIVWLYDANVLYFSASHIPRFLAALIIIILGAVYTILLLFGQTFYHCSHYRIMKWVSHPKYDSFIREYHAPLSPKHRYWVGLLLLARIIHYLISAFVSNSIIILSVGIMASGLILLKLLNKTIYKNWVIDALETSFLFNLVVMALTTFYVDKVHGDQQALAYTSMTASFVTFLGIVSYHLFEKCWTKLRGLCQRVQESFNRHRLYQPVPTEESDSEDLSDGSEHDYETELVEYTADNSDQDRVDSPPLYYAPPIIRRAERDDQLREPALDDLSPVRPEDYNVLPPPQPRRQQMTTYTEVDIRADRDNDN